MSRSDVLPRASYAVLLCDMRNRSDINGTCTAEAAEVPQQGNTSAVQFYVGASGNSLIKTGSTKDLGAQGRYRATLQAQDTSGVTAPVKTWDFDVKQVSLVVRGTKGTAMLSVV